jgi:hypothetical protein
MAFRVLIIGGTGQVGAAVVRALAAEPSCAEVVMVNRKAISLTAGPRVRQVILDTAAPQFSAEVTKLAQSMVAQGDPVYGASCVGVGKGSMKWSEEELKALEIGVVGGFNGLGEIMERMIRTVADDVGGLCDSGLWSLGPRRSFRASQRSPLRIPEIDRAFRTHSAFRVTGLFFHAVAQCACIADHAQKAEMTHATAGAAAAGIIPSVIYALRCAILATSIVASAAIRWPAVALPWPLAGAEAHFGFGLWYSLRPEGC